MPDKGNMEMFIVTEEYMTFVPYALSQRLKLMFWEGKKPSHRGLSCLCYPWRYSVCQLRTTHKNERKIIPLGLRICMWWTLQTTLIHLRSPRTSKWEVIPLHSWPKDLQSPELQEDMRYQTSRWIKTHPGYILMTQTVTIIETSISWTHDSEKYQYPSYPSSPCNGCHKIYLIHLRSINKIDGGTILPFMKPRASFALR